MGEINNQSSFLHPAVNKPSPFPHLHPVPQKPWSENENMIWLASTLRIVRNVEKFHFSSRLEPDRKKQLVALLGQAINGLSLLQNPRLIKAEELSPLEKDFLTEHYLVLHGIQEARPGQAIIIDDTGQFLSLMNFDDHLQLQYTECNGDLEKSLGTLLELEKNLSRQFAFAFTDKFGFLTQDPLISGTALVVTSYLHLPALILTGKVHELLQKERDQLLFATGLQGNPDDLLGDIILLRNSCTLGITEENILSTLRDAILRLVIAEKHARKNLTSEEMLLVEDKISRALGTLKFSYRLDTAEALQVLSMLKFGIEMGHISGMSVKEVNRLFFSIRRAHLCMLLGGQVSPEELATKRASFVREKTQNLTITFRQQTIQKDKL